MGELKVTPALLIALFQKPQDRVFLIDLENSVLDFVESSAYTYQLKPMNSYYRLLSHQVAEYHGLQHTVSKDNDKCVIVFKQNDYEPNSRLVLLQQLEPQVMYQFPPEYYALASMAAANSQQQLMHKTMRQKSRQNSQQRTSVPTPEPASENKSAMEDQSTGDTNDTQGATPASVVAQNSVKKKVKILRREVTAENKEGKEKSQEPAEATLDQTTNGKDTDPGKAAATVDLEEQRRIKQQQYDEEKEKIFSGSPSSLTPVSTPPATPATLHVAGIPNDKEDDSPQPHQFETSRFRLNNQNEMKYMKKPQYQHNNKKQNFNNNNRYNKPPNRQLHMQPYYGYSPSMAPMRADPMAFGYPMVAPMEYMYYPMGAQMPNNQVMMPGQPIYAMPPPIYQPYEKKNGGRYDYNGYKRNGETKN
ncbi:unnamed protein product [Kluyveromyces dobzhanskii CBS 2104]|uniref:WGS project CCBQ000000000 data, contig 00015 n=1 Tax=Kluyveromyces dobzhanskii CBS 2104 TaxID=1427455 RepID=A0A0A8LBT1_9SACH|nr:unnamed protein product [Kluyveromyces dobzhanskii CBS 2104]